ncbi:MAG: NAD(P)/FAD-dependent oxidoreductase [Flavobacteriaceae bacterium]
MKLSFWEYKSWLSNIDYTVVGSGIVGLNCALSLRKKFPHARILVLEKGVLPQGASTKNAGFACFGSISEILADLKTHSEEEVFELVRLRWEGIILLRDLIGDKSMDFQQHGGHELFFGSDREHYELCMQETEAINKLLYPIFRRAAFETIPNSFSFKQIHNHYLSNMQEGQLDTGKMMRSLLKKAHQNEITILNSVAVTGFDQLNNGVAVQTNAFDFKTDKLLIATNGFAPQLLNVDMKPARAQVLITKPIPDLHFHGTFHMDEGYFYFRNVENRVLLGGARNLDPEGETTAAFGTTSVVQNRLEDLLREVILGDIPFVIDQRWSGIMGMGEQKRPILKQLEQDVFCGIRLGGMGIAIGSIIGKSLSNFID